MYLQNMRLELLDCENFTKYRLHFHAGIPPVYQLETATGWAILGLTRVELDIANSRCTLHIGDKTIHCMTIATIQEQ